MTSLKTSPIEQWKATCRDNPKNPNMKQVAVAANPGRRLPPGTSRKATSS